MPEFCTQQKGPPQGAGRQCWNVYLKAGGVFRRCTGPMSACVFPSMRVTQAILSGNLVLIAKVVLKRGAHDLIKPRIDHDLQRLALCLTMSEVHSESYEHR